MNMQLGKEHKQQIIQAVDERDALLREISLRIHTNPELSFHEHKAQAGLPSR
ncbi:hypothetical protein [Paenibacillus oralis]|uniref:hypothetical protein n=1 Tax=Paenibacillus oralis TaxID=2490856 RepID=UPI001FE4E5C4|nr:hypothetical protein [Paenibacillus oralis]